MKHKNAVLGKKRVLHLNCIAPHMQQILAIRSPSAPMNDTAAHLRHKPDVLHIAMIKHPNSGSVSASVGRRKIDFQTYYISHLQVSY